MFLVPVSYVVSYFTVSFTCVTDTSKSQTKKSGTMFGISTNSYSMPAHHKNSCVSKQTGCSRWRWCDLCFSINMPFNTTICGLLEEKTLKTQQSPDNSSEGYCSDPSPIFMCKLFWKLEFISC